MLTEAANVLMGKIYSEIKDAIKLSKNTERSVTA